MATSWQCDGCGKQAGKDEAYLEWTYDKDHKYIGFRIIHNKTACSAYRGRKGLTPLDVPLSNALGENGLVMLLSLIDPGRHKAPKATSPETSDWRGIVEIIRRLHVPNYEEARSKMGSADPAMWPADGNETWVYSQEALHDLIKGKYDDVR